MERHKERVERILGEIAEAISNIAEAVSHSVKDNKKSFSSLTKKIETLMAKQADFQKVLDRIDTATNGLAAEVIDLKSQVEEAVKSAGLDAATEDAILAKFDSVASKLESIGKEEAPAPTEPAPIDPTAPEVPATDVPA